MIKAYRAFLLAGAVGVLASPAAAKPPADPRIAVLQQQLRDLEAQLAEIKRTPAGSGTHDDDAGAALGDLKRSTSAQYVDINNRLDAQTRTGLANGRLTFASADGEFSLSLRSLIQFDAGYFSQGRNPAAVDLNSGTNFRRAQFGFVGTAWKDWSYNFTYDFGGNGTEKNGYIYSAYLQYDGLRPFGVRVGAFAPPAGLEDATGSADLLFLERPASADIARNIAGSPSREGISIFVQDDTYLVSLAYTGGKATDASTFDEQQGVVGRASWLALSGGDVKWLLDADFSHVFKIGDTVANAANNPANNVFSFSSGPELAIDGSKTVGTGTIDASTVTQYGFETAATWGSLYGQGGYFHYDIGRRASALPDPDFSGFYALVTWSITGESHRYDPVTASFRGLRPTHPLGHGGLGAWELKARYSNIDLNDQPLLPTASGGVAGGEQNVWTVGVNWYPTDGIRFALDYDNIQVNHPNAPATDISASAIALRSQISL